MHLVPDVKLFARGRLRERARPFALIAAALMLLWDNYPLLLQHGPPMLPRDGRAAAIVLVLAAFGLVVAALGWLVRRIGASATGWRRSGGITLAWIFAAAAVAAVTQLLFFAVHYACYTAMLCERGLLPERILYTLGISFSPIYFVAPLAFALTTVVAWPHRP